MNDSQWKKEVKEWLFKHKNIQSDLEQDFITFFEYAFIHTCYPEQAWFGIHKEVISLVIGGIFLAAVHFCMKMHIISPPFTRGDGVAGG